MAAAFGVENGGVGLDQGGGAGVSDGGDGAGCSCEVGLGVVKFFHGEMIAFSGMWGNSETLGRFWVGVRRRWLSEMGRIGILMQWGVICVCAYLVGGYDGKD